MDFFDGESTRYRGRPSNFLCDSRRFYEISKEFAKKPTNISDKKYGFFQTDKIFFEAAAKDG
jgi:hypothetical protein